MSGMTPDDEHTIIAKSGTIAAIGLVPDDYRQRTNENSVGKDTSANAITPINAQSATSLKRTTPELSSHKHSSAGKSGNALPVGTYLSEFELTSVLGEGGFGIVYLAWDHSLERQIALKEYMPSSLSERIGSTHVQIKSSRYQDTFDAGMKSFINEAKLLASFDHPSLVKVYRFWEANGTAYMVMPFYEGVTLKDKLSELAQPPDEAWLMAFLAPLTEALAVLHLENCFHRDIAPDNVILLNATGMPLLLDFGAARRIIGDMTQALTVIVKPSYAPIEQYAETPNMNQGPWTDIYALAASVHYAIMGKTPPTSVSRLMNDTYRPLEQAAEGRYSVGFLQAMDRALRLRPEERTQNICELRFELNLSETLLEPNAAAIRLPPAVAQSTAVKATGRQPIVAHVVTRSMGPMHGVGLWISLGLMVLAVAGAGIYYVLTLKKPAAAMATIPATPRLSPEIAAQPAIKKSLAAPVVFNIKDEFNKIVVAQTPGFRVDAHAIRPKLRIGKDALSFTVQSARAGFVQVLVLGPDGSALLLFPNAQASDNRIRAGDTLTLPRASWKLDTAEPIGTENFLVIVSEQPRDYSELSKTRDYIFLKLPTEQKGLQLAATWTRSTPMLLGGLKNCASADCDAYGAAQFSVEIIR